MRHGINGQYGSGVFFYVQEALQIPRGIAATELLLESEIICLLIACIL